MSRPMHEPTTEDHAKADAEVIRKASPEDAERYRAEILAERGEAYYARVRRHLARESGKKELRIRRLHVLVGGAMHGQRHVVDGIRAVVQITQMLTCDLRDAADVVHHSYKLRRSVFPCGSGFSFYAHESLSYGEARNLVDLMAYEALAAPLPENDEFVAALTLTMCADPSPLDGPTEKAWLDFVNREAQARGYASWVEAYRRRKEGAAQ